MVNFIFVLYSLIHYNMRERKYDCVKLFHILLSKINSSDLIGIIKVHRLTLFLLRKISSTANCFGKYIKHDANYFNFALSLCVCIYIWQSLADHHYLISISITISTVWLHICYIIYIIGRRLNKNLKSFIKYLETALLALRNI